MTHQTITETGLPCRNCQGHGCLSCEGKGHGSCLQLPGGYLAEITPGTAGWSWTLLHRGLPVDGGIRATQDLAQDSALHRYAGIETDRLADQLAFAILLAAFAELGFTRAAVGAAYAAVALTDQIEEN